MQLLALNCLNHLMLWDLLTLITTAIVHRYSKLDSLQMTMIHDVNFDRHTFSQNATHYMSKSSARQPFLTAHMIYHA